MNDQDLKSEIRQLRDELEVERRHRRAEEGSNAFGVIIWLAGVVGTGYWLVNGGFGEVARFLFVMGVFQH